jgi:hypothetical protein
MSTMASSCTLVVVRHRSEADRQREMPLEHQVAMSDDRFGHCGAQVRIERLEGVPNGRQHRA